MEIRVVIAGCRWYQDYEEAKGFLDDCLQEYGNGNKIIVVSGGADGADCLAKRYAYENGFALEEYPAEWKRYGKAAGPKRNQEMACRGDLVVCFWDETSKGTRSMIQAAQKAKKPLMIKKIQRKKP